MKGKLKSVAIFLILSLFMFLEGNILHGATCNDDVTGTLTNFYCTIKKLELSKNGGATYVTVFDNNTTEVDLVAVSGQNVGSVLASNSNIPAGHYNYSRVTVTNSRIVLDMSYNGNTGTLTIGAAGGAYEPPQGYPVVEEDTVDLTVNVGGTTNAVINFDAASSYAGSTFCHQSGSTFTPDNFVFDPQITVSE